MLIYVSMILCGEKKLYKKNCDKQSQDFWI